MGSFRHNLQAVKAQSDSEGFFCLLRMEAAEGGPYMAEVEIDGWLVPASSVEAPAWDFGWLPRLAVHWKPPVGVALFSVGEPRRGFWLKKGCTL